MVSISRPYFTKDIESFGLYLWWIELSGNSRSKLIRIFIDKKNGVDIDDCQKVSNQVNELLTNIELVSFDYTLEVSSPGLDRKFFYNEQYKDYLNELLKVTFFDSQNKKTIQGRLEEVDKKSIKLEMKEGPMQIAFSSIIQANLII